MLGVPLCYPSEGTKTPKPQRKGHAQVLNCRQAQCLESPNAREQKLGAEQR